MNSRKNQNSIIVLATLGVYLGLMLAGATPQVLAQAAMTRQFDVKDEIEVKDDLDNNPNEKLPADVIENYFWHVEEFIDELKGLPQEHLFQALKTPFEIETLTTLPCINGSRVGSGNHRNTVKSELIWPYLRNLSNRLGGGYDLGDCVASDKFDGRRATVSGLQILFDENSLSVEINVQKRSIHFAGLLSHALTTELANYDLADISKTRQQIIANTSFRSENDQVFIVTRLPRAGLDALLASDAK